MEAMKGGFSAKSFSTLNWGTQLLLPEIWAWNDLKTRIVPMIGSGVYWKKAQRVSTVRFQKPLFQTAIFGNTRRPNMITIRGTQGKYKNVWIVKTDPKQ